MLVGDVIAVAIVFLLLYKLDLFFARWLIDRVRRLWGDVRK